MTRNTQPFSFFLEQFADIKIMRFQVPGFDSLSLAQKKLIFFLSQAALEGRDIIYDQNNRFNLKIRRTLEAIVTSDNFQKKNNNDSKLEEYLLRVWFSNGIHHHYSMDKFKPEFPKDFFIRLVQSINPDKLPILKGQTVHDLLEEIVPIIFDENLVPKRVNQAAGGDLIQSSANNYYGDGVTQGDVERFYADTVQEDKDRPISIGLNSQLVWEGENLVERTWKMEGMYDAAIQKILYWLKLASNVCENPEQKASLDNLLDFYRTGSLKSFDNYSIAWLKDENSKIDFINGFIETYGDALGLKASWESIVNFKDEEASKRTEILSGNAQWFEDHSPVNAAYKKKRVKGVSARVINVAMLGGDCYPATPIGVNLPNSDWIRKEYGSKSVTIENITYSYHKVNEGNGLLEEFAFDNAEVARHKAFGYITNNLHTDLHECLGHGSGQLADGIKGDELKAYGATIEEARADLFGLFYMADEKLVDLALLPSPEAYKTAYDSYIKNGLMIQLTRIAPGEDVIESHMRNRQLIARWSYEKGKEAGVIQKRTRNNKTYFVVEDYQKLRTLFGKLLQEIQRIKSEGDFYAAQELVESYAVKVDMDLHEEVLNRFKKLNIAPYAGFVNPVYELMLDGDEIVDVKISYSESYRDQMLRYSKNHSWLPNEN